MSYLALLGLRGENFRLFEKLELALHPRLNLLIGENAAGKTSFLEAVYCLGRAKSFRGNSPAELAGGAGRHWAVTGKLQSDEGPADLVKVRWSTEGTQLRLGSTQKPTTAELIARLPLQIIDPGMHRLLQDGPGYRRSFLDWGVFHVEHQFLDVWRQHQRALKQRNRALRLKSSPREIRAWDAELAVPAEELQRLRRQHLDALRPLLQDYVQQLFNTRDISAELHAGWPEEQGYLATLERQLERDRRMGTTVDGAHRAELRLRLDQHQVKNRISRGQQKLLIAALILAQSRLIHQHSGRAPILLVDDFSAELASGFQAALAGLFAAYPGQVIITAFERVPALESFADLAMFHVEHGQVRRA
jgi:DNA replication and repair protein RecF